ncbi:RNA polymerase sigma factor [Peloplasma aerotolerans]|jgi:RNA polymerase sigma-70 factor, ECF subfamily|uniref:RNA polymerase sigma factor n=1 Tax=Peloplasma aerotolerans TaxID=3044389 RepID=A0AAW6UE85_9MOLU|nr:RNA polymerase sigma factor [Mariniplasma sp. M4Ah]MDI6453751.1 RNA polymerase sigma factor [Mariniplasma sp. M4Ah]
MDQIHAIIEELKKRNYQSFDTFYNLTKNQVFYAIINIVKDQDLAEDIMQDTYVKFLEKIEQYKSGSNPYAYLSTIARNLAINTYNREKRVINSQEIVESIPSPEEETDQEDIFKILDLLEDVEKEVVTLHIINDLKFREIADTIDKPLGTVLWIYNKAIKKLRAKVGDIL